MMTKKLIDTTILVYLYDKTDLNKHEKAKNTVKALQQNNEGVLSIQNIVEFARVLSEKAKPHFPHIEVINFVLQLLTLFEVINYEGKTVINALQLSSNYKLHFFDALLIATMEENLIFEIITENEKDFKKVTNLKVLNPFN